MSLYDRVFCEGIDLPGLSRNVDAWKAALKKQGGRRGVVSNWRQSQPGQIGPKPKPSWPANPNMPY